MTCRQWACSYKLNVGLVSQVDVNAAEEAEFIEDESLFYKPGRQAPAAAQSLPQGPPLPVSMPEARSVRCMPCRLQAEAATAVTRELSRGLLMWHPCRPPVATPICCEGQFS